MKFLGTLVLWIVASISVMAQQNPMFYTEIQLRHKPYTLQSLTEEIQAQSGISFSYDANKINPDTKIKLKGDKLTVAVILATVRKKTDIGYKIISNTHIIYTDPGANHKASKPAKQKPSSHQANNKKAKQKNLAGRGTPATIKQYNIAHTSFIKDEANDNANVVIVGDSSAVSSYYAGSTGFVGAGGSGGGSGNVATDEDVETAQNNSSIGNWEDDIRAISANRQARTNTVSSDAVLNFFKEHLLFSAGLSADETYYCDPTVRVGLSFLYGTFSYNVGSPSSWRFGLGGSAKINDKWSIHFNYSSGPAIPKGYTVAFFDTIPPVDSATAPTINETDKPLVVSSKLTRYGMSFNYKLGNGFSLEGGMILNSLKTNYSSSGNPVTLSDFLPFGVDADSKYYSIKPPYVLGNSYSANQTSNTKIWIGFQVSLFYSLRFLER